MNRTPPILVWALLGCNTPTAALESTDTASEAGSVETFDDCLGTTGAAEPDIQALSVFSQERFDVEHLALASFESVETATAWAGSFPKDAEPASIDFDTQQLDGLAWRDSLCPMAHRMGISGLAWNVDADALVAVIHLLRAASAERVAIENARSKRRAVWG